MHSFVWWQLDRIVGDTEVFAIDLSQNHDREREALDLLDKAEVARYRGFQVATPGRQYLLSRAALRTLLGERLNESPGHISFDRLPYGKPYAVIEGRPAPLCFNLSHSENFGMIAISTSRRVGIDLEHRRPLADLDGVAERVFQMSERQTLSRLAGQSRIALFYRLWTYKEALMKAKGTGFSYDPIRFQVPDAILNGAASARFGFPDDADEEWILTDIGTQDYAAALAYSSHHIQRRSH